MRAFIRKITMLFFVLALVIPAMAQTNTWTNANGTGIWSDDGNWSSGVAPDGSESIRFDATSTDDCFIDAGANATLTGVGLTLAAGYTGTITIDDAVAFEIGIINLNAGHIVTGTNTFTCTSLFFGNNITTVRSFDGTNASQITIGGTLSFGTGTSNNATFRASSNTTNGTSIGGTLTYVAGTFVHNSGKFRFTAGGARTVPNFTFYDLELYNSTNAAVTITFGTSVTVNNTLYLSGNSSSSTLNFATGTINLKGNLDVSAHNATTVGTTLTGTINMNGTSAQSIVGNVSSSTGAIPNLTIGNTTAAVTISSGSLYVGGAFTINSSASFSTGGNTISFGGNIANSGTFTPSTSTIFLRHSAAQSINFGAGASINTLTCSKSSNTATINAATTITDLLTCTGGTLNLNGNVTIASTASKTANVGNSTGGTISGNANVQRFITSAGRRYRFLASPVSGATMSAWKNTIHITGTGGAANNFDPTVGDQPSVYTYDETLITGDLNTGWVSATNGSTDPLTIGKGFRVFIRGSRSGAKLVPPYDPQDAVTLSVTGPLNNGNFVFSPTFTSSGNAANDGWNMLGNPYACGYDWNSFYDAGSNRTNMDPTVYIFDGTTNAYLSYNASSNTGGLTSGIIPSGSAFYIKATGASPALTFTEAFKSTITPSSTFKMKEPELEIIMETAASNEIDKYYFKVMPGSTNNYDGFDIIKLSNANVNVSSYGQDGQQLTASVIPELTDLTIIPLKVVAAKASTFKFTFNGVNGFTGSDFVLIDKFKNTTTPLMDSTTYSFVMDSVTGSYGDKRFEIAIAKNRTSIDKYFETINNILTATVYPNPAVNELNIEVNKNAKIEQVSVFDISGKQVTNYTSTGSKLDISNLSNGTYLIEVMTNQGRLTTKFVK